MLGELVRQELIRQYQMTDPEIPVAQICAGFGINPPSLYHVLYEEGIPLRGRQAAKPQGEPTFEGARKRKRMLIDRLYSPTTKQRIADLYDRGDVASGSVRGWSARKISKQLNIPYNHVVAMLHQARVSVLPGNSQRVWNDVREAIVEAFGDKSKTLDDIVAEFGIPLGA